MTPKIAFQRTSKDKNWLKFDRPKYQQKMLEDQELKNKSSAGDTITITLDPYTNGLVIIGLAKEEIDAYGSFFQDFYDKINHKYYKRITRNPLTMLRGAVFALGSEKLNNPEWKEHCASSLREILHEWKSDLNNKFQENFQEFYRAESQPFTGDERETFNNFKLHYQYFSGIAHHEASGIMASLRAILKRADLKLEDCYTDDIFIARVKDFFSCISKIINYSKNKD